MTRAFLRDTYGLEPGSVRLLPGGATAQNYCVGGALLVKRHLLAADTLAFEEACLERLAAVGFPAPVPVRTVGGAWVTSFEGRPVTALRYIPGRALRRFTAAQLSEVGGLLARLHVELGGLEPPAERPSWDPGPYQLAFERDGEGLRHHPHLDGLEWHDYGRRELARFEGLASLPTGVTHQDVKPENVIAGNGLHLIDFGNARRGAWLFDLLTVAIWEALDAPRLELLTAGYRAQRPLTEPEVEVLGKALRYRLLRESLSWPLRHHTPESAAHARHFRARYEAVSA